MTQNEDEIKTPQWLIDGSKEILELLGYDLTKDVHAQFMERFKEELARGNRPKRGRPKKTLPESKT